MNSFKDRGSFGDRGGFPRVKKVLMGAALIIGSLLLLFIVFVLIAAGFDSKPLRGLSYGDRLRLRWLHPMAARTVGTQVLDAEHQAATVKAKRAVGDTEAAPPTPIPSDVSTAAAPAATQGAGNAAV